MATMTVDEADDWIWYFEYQADIEHYGADAVRAMDAEDDNALDNNEAIIAGLHGFFGGLARSMT